MPRGKYDTFRSVAALLESSQWKVIGLYNPAGWGWVNFAKYFEKELRILKNKYAMISKSGNLHKNRTRFKSHLMEQTLTDKVLTAPVKRQ